MGPKLNDIHRVKVGNIRNGEIDVGGFKCVDIQTKNVTSGGYIVLLAEEDKALKLPEDDEAMVIVQVESDNTTFARIISAEGMDYSRRLNHNTNCLNGLRCPKCGSLGPFKMSVMKTVMMGDGGTEDEDGDIEYVDSTTCDCQFCGHVEKIESFRDRSFYNLVTKTIEDNVQQGR